MEKVNVLVFPGAGYPAIEICTYLKHSMRFHVIAASSYPNHSEFVCTETITDLPFITDPTFFDAFNNLLQQRNISYVIPTDETSAMLLSKEQANLSATIVSSPYETALLCRHKKLTYERLAGKPYLPRVYSVPAEVSAYPVFVKPDDGQGGRGAQIIKSPTDFCGVAELSRMVICEYLPGEEYTVDCFTRGDGKLLFCNPRIRARIMNGITARGQNVPCTEEFLTIVRDLNNEIKFHGYWFVQLKRDTLGALKLMEICTRFAGSFGISQALGVNLPLMALCDFAGLPCEAIANRYKVICDKTYIDRYFLDIPYDHVYIDYDDTVTAENGTRVNAYILAFLYQCRAKDIRVTLLTRHADTYQEPLADSMQRLSLCPTLFQEIVELTWRETKTEHIAASEGSIFIDNSFSERKAVAENCHIPVFDVDNIDCLFDWREP